MKTLKLYLLSIACMASLTSYAQGVRDAALADRAQIWFRQSKINLDTTFHDNGTKLHEMLQRVKDREATDSALTINKIKVVGAASPEGNVKFNDYLSEQRAMRIFDYFKDRVDLPDSITEYQFDGRDWQGLLMMVKDNPNVPSREKVIELVETIIANIEATGQDNEHNLTLLKQLDYSVPYAYLYKHIFPQLRYSSLYLEYAYKYPGRLFNSRIPAPDLSVTVPSPTVDLVFNPYFSGMFKQCRPFYMGLKTNLLYDAAALPSIGAEFYLGKNWSITADWTYGWWSRNSTHHYWRAYGGYVGVRKWFGKAAHRKPLTGHHAGLYAGVMTFDFELGGKGYMGGLPHGTIFDRCLYTAGVEYGYALPIARRLNLDFSIGFGVVHGKIIKYHPDGDCYHYDSTHKITSFIPTKLEVSLVWLIGCDNYNRRK